MEGRGQVSSGWMLCPLLPFSGPHDPQPPTLTAGCTGETGIVVEVPHGLAGLAGSKHTFAAFHTGSCEVKNTAVSQKGTV